MTAEKILTLAFEPDIKELDAVLRDEQVVSLRLNFQVQDDFKKVAKRIIKLAPAHLENLALSDLGFEADGEVGRCLLTAKATGDFLAALPGLRKLTLVGHAWFPVLEHPELRALALEGYPFGTSGPLQAKAAACPKLEELKWAFRGDEFGVALPPSALKTLWSAAGLPALRRLDISGIDIDGILLQTKPFVDGQLLKQLEHIAFPFSNVDKSDFEELLPRLGHLKTMELDDTDLVELDQRISYIEPPKEELPEASPVFQLPNATDKQVQQARLETVSGLRAILLNWHQLTTEGARLIGKAGLAQPTLSTLDLSKPLGSELRAEALAAIQEEIGTHPGLTILKLRGNRFEGTELTFAKLLLQLPALEHLDISQCDLDEDDIQLLVPALNAMPALKELRVGNMSKTDEAARAWGQLCIPTLQELAIWTTRFSDVGAPLFLKDIGARLPALKYLDLDACHLGPAAMQVLADGLKGHKIERLDLSIRADKRGYEALGTLLEGTQLRRLMLDEEKAREGDIGASPASYSALARGTSIEYLDLEHTGSDTQEEVDAIVAALSKMPSLTYLTNFYLDDPSRAAAVADALSALPLRRFGKISLHLVGHLCKRNAIEEVCIEAGYRFDAWLEVLAEPLTRCTSLVALRFRKGELTKIAGKLIPVIATENTSLRELEVALAIKDREGPAFVGRFKNATHLHQLKLPWVSEATDAAIAKRLKNGPKVSRADFSED